MSLERGFSWNYGELQFVGYSLAGITTSVYFQTAGVCFDVGQGLPFQNSARHLLITHAHLDHASGIPYLLAQKSMAGQKESNVYVPSSLREPLAQILGIWQKLDEHTFPFSLHVARPGEMVSLGGAYAMRAFATVHRVESRGYLLFQKRKKLKTSFAGASKEEILGAKAAGEDPVEEIMDPIVAFTGDTQIEGLFSDPEVARAKVLFVECTFWDEAKPIFEARKWGHIHLDELLEVLPRLQNEKVVLIHTSARYSLAYLQGILKKRLSPTDLGRVEIFPRPA